MSEHLATRKLVVRNELERIYDERGRLTTDDVVAAAADPTNPLHSFFEWDDSVAADKHRKQQAAGLIRSVRITVTRERNGNVEDLKVRGWIAARSTGTELPVNEGYLPESEVRSQPELREALLRQMRREINAVHRRYEHLSEFWEVVDELSTQREKQAS